MARLVNKLNAKRIVQFYENIGGIENPLSCRWQLNISKNELLGQLFRLNDITRLNERGRIDYHKITVKPPKRSVKSVKNLMERKPETSVTSDAIITEMPEALFNIWNAKNSIFELILKR
jgi:hypothetical protein